MAAAGASCLLVWFVHNLKVSLILVGKDWCYTKWSAAHWGGQGLCVSDRIGRSRPWRLAIASPCFEMPLDHKTPGCDHLRVRKQKAPHHFSHTGTCMSKNLSICMIVCREKGKRERVWSEFMFGHHWTCFFWLTLLRQTHHCYDLHVVPVPDQRPLYTVYSWSVTQLSNIFLKRKVVKSLVFNSKQRDTSAKGWFRALATSGQKSQSSDSLINVGSNSHNLTAANWHEIAFLFLLTSCDECLMNSPQSDM